MDLKRLRPVILEGLLLPSTRQIAKPLHPGAVLREQGLPAIRVSRTELARMLGITTLQLRSILQEEKSITPDVAASLGKIFGNGAKAWIAMQAAHDGWVAEHEVDVSSVPALAAPLLAIASNEGPQPLAPAPRRAALLLVAAGAVLVLLVAMGVVFMALLPFFLGAAFIAGGVTYGALQRLQLRRSSKINKG